MTETTPCRYCLEPVTTGAARCPHCTSWRVARPRTGAQSVLYVMGWLWLVASVLGAVVLWYNLAINGSTAIGLAAQGVLVGCIVLVLAGLGHGDGRG